MLKALRALPGERRNDRAAAVAVPSRHNEAIALLRARRAPVELESEQADLHAGVADGPRPASGCASWWRICAICPSASAARW